MTPQLHHHQNIYIPSPPKTHLLFVIAHIWKQIPNPHILVFTEHPTYSEKHQKGLHSHPTKNIKYIAIFPVWKCPEYGTRLWFVNQLSRPLRDQAVNYACGRQPANWPSLSLEKKPVWVQRWFYKPQSFCHALRGTGFSTL